MDEAQLNAAWLINDQRGIDSLTFVDKIRIPVLNAGEVLVKIQAASLNYRDLAITKGGSALGLNKTNLVLGSDGAGVVEAIASDVEVFKVGDRVCTHLTCGLSSTEMPSFSDICGGLGHTKDGTLQQYGVFHESSLVTMPYNLSFKKAATLTCSGLTAWNALFGLTNKAAGPGKVVLIQGSGGVSVAALQFAVAAGASVIATTSSDEKGAKLRSIGAKHVLNYKQDQNWGEAAKALTPNSRGVDIVVDVGGASTLAQSLKAVRVDGLIAATGVLGSSLDGTVPTILDCLFAACVVRGVLLGSREQFQLMNQFIEEHDLKPVLDQKEFNLATIKDAFHYVHEQKHFSKVTIDLS